MKDELIAKIESRETVVGVIGLGYVGLPLAREFLKKNFTVLGFDVMKKKSLKLAMVKVILNILGQIS
jgi:UDP-N-acetyl-D-glucosamine dehydrogenase